MSQLLCCPVVWQLVLMYHLQDHKTCLSIKCYVVIVVKQVGKVGKVGNKGRTGLVVSN